MSEEPATYRTGDPGDEQPEQPEPARTCACVAEEPHVCIGLRYGRTYEQIYDDLMTGEAEYCECACHYDHEGWTDDDA